MGTGDILKGVQSLQLGQRRALREGQRLDFPSTTPAFVDFVLIKPSDKHGRALNQLEKSRGQINCSKESKEQEGNHS